MTTGPTILRAAAPAAPAAPGALAAFVALALAGSGCDDSRPFDGLEPPADGPRGELVASVTIPPDYGIHDMFVRDGVVFVSAWNTGVIIYDIGGAAGVGGTSGTGGTGGAGTPETPRELSRFVPTGGNVTGRIHNAWWFHDPATGERRYLFLGQEGPSTGSRASGDIFALDVSDLTVPEQVGRYALADGGAHNFWMDEEAAILYAAYYNGGVVALDVSGTLPEDLAEREIARVRPAGDATYVWGVQLHRGSLYATDMPNGFYQLRLVEGEGAAAGDAGFLVLAGGGNVPERFSSDLWLHGDHAYTGTWGQRGLVRGDALKIWTLDAAGAPSLADSVVFDAVGTVSDVEVSADGSLLLVSAENGGGSGIHLFTLDDPLAPSLLWHEPIATGIHTVTFGRVDGRTFVFGAKNPPSPALLIYEITALLP